MNKLCQKIGVTKRKLEEVANLMDETYRLLQDATYQKEQEIKEFKKQFIKTNYSNLSDKEKIIRKIKARMLYLYRTTSPFYRQKIEELAYLLDYIEEYINDR
jgi:hypothetical protein